MPKVKYDVSKATPGQDYNHAKPGLYKAKIVEVNVKSSKAGNPMLEVVLQPAKKKKKDKDFAKVFYYILTDGSQDGRLREFTDACGLKAKGTLDTDKLVGSTVQINLKSDTDQDGEYRPKVGKVMSEGADPDSDDSDEEPDDEEDEDEDDDDNDDDEDDEDSDDDDDDDDDDEDSDDEEDEEGYTKDELEDLETSDLKDIAKEWEILDDIDGKKTKRALINAILEAQEEGDEDEDDDEEEDDEQPDYSEWELADLKKELKSRGLATKGKSKQLVKRLEEDDASDEDPFEDDDDDE